MDQQTSINRKSQFLIAAPMSGSGKTTLSCGLMSLFTRKGWKVQPYKCGPDYIDTKYHLASCGHPSINLDRFMASDQHLQQLYASHAQDADICIVEGMMGMYDGYERDRGSSADIARLLHLPVVLVVDARSAAYSMAPLLSGFLHFRPEVEVAGVIFNRVGSEKHYAMLREVCEDLDVNCLGYLPREKGLEQESRYLGLDFSRMDGGQGDKLVALLEKYVDWKLLLEKTKQPFSMEKTVFSSSENNVEQNASTAQSSSTEKPKHILVARNEESFSFLYEEHLEILRRLGKVSFFNPEQDFPIPTNIDLLYLPGGYPEKHAEALSRARRTLVSIREYIEGGGHTLAECGGMIYLSQGICFDDANAEHGSYEPMVGVLPFVISNQKQYRRLNLGYRQFEYQGQRLKGHEFHYTRILPEENKMLPASIAQVFDARGREVDTPIFRYKNTIASYTHLYWGEAEKWIIDNG
ncbi:MAG: cobyrinate a,c-diamide synthase [Bacteroides sp.]|nr:cobyrinate a,c-diamide synthase [Bacteroides sp.]